MTMIFLSAGHYPSKPGASFERFIEHDEAIIWVHKIEALCDEEVVTVPTGVLKEKVAFINERVMDGDCAVEIHFNAARNAEGQPIGRGSETLYYPGSEPGKVLAEKFQKVLGEIFPPDRGVKEGWYRMDPSRGADFFLAKTKCPAIIIEPEFVHRSNLIYANRDAAIDALVKVMKEL